MKFELVEHHRNISKEELLNDVKRVAAIYNKTTLTRSEYKSYGKYGANTYLRRFGSWNTVLELAGLSVTALQHAGSLGSHNYAEVTNQQLIQDLQRVSNLLEKKSFSCGEYDRIGEYSRSTIFRRFGSWNNALIAANLQPFDIVSGKRISDEDLLNEIGRLWEILGHQPTTVDVKSGKSLYSLHAFTSHFGSWRYALESFVSYINSGEIVSMEQSVSKNTKTIITSVPTTHKFQKQFKHKTLREPNLKLRFLVMQRDNFKCCYCGASPAKDSSVVLHIDHIIPWSKGGETVYENLQTLCQKCNLGAGDLSK